MCEGVAAQRTHDSINLSAMIVMDVDELLEFGLDDLHDDEFDNYHWSATDDFCGE